MRCFLLTLLLSIFSLQLPAQDDLMDLLDAEQEEQKSFTIATFKGTRIVNGHSIEMPAAGVMQMQISHRFGRVNTGLYELFGLDQANIRLGLDYGITPWLTVGAGRSNVLKTYDGYAKARLLRQSSGKGAFPFSLSVIGATALNTLRWPDTTRENYFSSRLDYTWQVLIARKFSDAISLQLMPTLVHRNLVPTLADRNDVFAIGAGGRWKFSRSASLNAEYYYVLPGQIVNTRISGRPATNSLALGLDIETGGHVFQLMVANSRNMTENLFITETDGKWTAADLHFGFAISRVFTVRPPKGLPAE